MENGKEHQEYFNMWLHKQVTTNDLQHTIKRGIILYIAAALLIIPSGICSQQHVTSDQRGYYYDVQRIITLANAMKLQQKKRFEQPRRIKKYRMHPDMVLLAKETTKDETPAVTATETEAPVEPPFHSLIMQAAETYQVDAALIKAIIMVESSYNPRAESKRGAQGLMQLMPVTAKSLGVGDTFNPALNIDGGVRYFRKLLDRFKGDVVLTLAAYNAGSRYVRKYGGVPPFKATRIYIKKVLHYQQKYQNEMAVNEAAATGKRT